LRTAKSKQKNKGSNRRVYYFGKRREKVGEKRSFTYKSPWGINELAAWFLLLITGVANNVG
jgi:hypothetical protein